MSHLIAKSSVSVNNIFMVWWTVLIISCSYYIYTTEVAILFLMLILDIITSVFFG